MASRSASAVNNRLVSNELFTQQCFPFGIREVALLYIINIRAISKKVDKSCAGIRIIRAAFRRTVAHIGGYATVEHQSGYGIHLVSGACAGEGCRHVGVVVRCVVVVHR